MVKYDWLSLGHDLTSLAKELDSVPRGTGTGQTKGIAIGGASKKVKPSLAIEMLSYPTLFLIDQ